MKRNSELIFKDLYDSEFGGAVKIVWNGSTIYNDADDGLYLDHILVKHQKKNFYDGYDHSIELALQKFRKKYDNKHIYSFYCRVVDFHHTELYIDGEN